MIFPVYKQYANQLDVQNREERNQHMSKLFIILTLQNGGKTY